MRIGTLALALALAAGAALAADEPGRVFGKLEIAKDGALSVKEKRGAFRIVVGDATEFRLFKAKIIGEGDDGTAHVLGRRISGGTDPNNPAGKVPETFGQIAIVVIGEDFEPPPVLPDIAAKGTTWLEGPLSRDKYGGWTLGGTIVAIGRDARAITVEKAEAKDAKKGMVAVVAGAVDAAAKKIEAKKVALCGPEVQPGELRLLFGL